LLIKIQTETMAERACAFEAAAEMLLGMTP